MRTFNLFRNHAILLCAVLAGLSPIACAYDSEAHKRDPELDRTLYLLATRPTAADALTECTKAEVAALNCAGGGAAAYLAALSAFYMSTISGPTGADVCTQIYASPLFTSSSTTITPGARVCHAQCNLLYWQNNSATCGSNFSGLLANFMTCGPAIWSVSCNSPTMKSCLQACFVTGTPLWYVP